MRKFLRPKFWSHGTHLGSLGPLSWKEGPLGFPQTQFRVTLDPYDLPVLVAWLGDPENPKLFRAWCDMFNDLRKLEIINLGVKTKMFFSFGDSTFNSMQPQTTHPALESKLSM